MSQSQWLRWKSWRSIRGPIGPDRDVALFAFLAMHIHIAAGRADGRKVDVNFKDFLDDARFFLTLADLPPEDDEEDSP